jgi:hypothetical protein
LFIAFSAIKFEEREIMRDLPSSERTQRRTELFDSLKEFLNAQSAALPKKLSCRECGAVLHYLPTQFWLDGEEKGWNIRLPYCKACDPLPATKELFVA